MATYLELHSLASDSDLHEKVAVAVGVAAQGILATTPTPAADRVAWAAHAMASTKAVAADAVKMVLAANKGLSVSAIQGASDTAIQSNVDDLVDALILAHAQ